MTSFLIRQIGVLSGQELIGDALIKLPFLRALRTVWPEAEIHWITTRGPTAYNGALRETVRFLIDEIHECPPWMARSDAAGWAPAFDLVIDTRGRWRLALIARRRLTHKLFIAPAFRYLFSDRRPPLFSARPERLVDRLLQTVFLASGVMPEVSGRLPLPPALFEKARRILPKGPVYVGLAPGAGNGIKKWPIERFEELAQRQIRLERTPVFILGPQEMDLYDRLCQSVPGAIFPLQAHDVWETKTPSVDCTLAVAACLDVAVAVANDSGTSHMLAAVDCPLVSLFGPTSAAKLAPRVSQGQVLCAQLFGGGAMNKIPLLAVEEAIKKVILLPKKA